MLRRNIILYYFAQGFAGLIFTLPIWVAFQQRFLNYTQMAWLQTASFLISIFIQLPTGAIADLVGRRRTIMFGWLVAGLANIYTGLTTNAIGMITGLIFVAIGTTFVSGADVALVYDSLKQLGRESEFPKINARGFLAYRLSMIVAIFFGGYLYQIFVGLPIIIKGTAWLGAMVVYYFAIEPQVDSEKFTLTNYVERMRQGFQELFKSTKSKLLSLFYILVGGITWSCLFYYINTLAKDVGFTELEQSWLFSPIYIVTTIIIIWLTSKKKIIPKQYVILGFPIIMLAGLLPGYFATKFSAIFMLTAMVFSGGARFAFLDGFVNEVFESRSRASALSTLNMLVTLLCAIIMFSFSWIQQFYLTTTVFSILGIITLILVLPLAILLNKVINLK